MLVKNEVSNVSAHGVAKTEIMILSPVANHRFTGFLSKCDEIPEKPFDSGELCHIDWEAIIVLNYCCQQTVSASVILVSTKILSRGYSEQGKVSS